MKKVFTIIYTILSLIALLALFLFAGLGLYRSYVPNRERCETTMDQMKSRSFNWQQGMLGIEDFDAVISGYFKTDERLLNVTVYSPREGILYTVSGGRVSLKGFRDHQNWQPEVWTGKPAYEDLPFFGFKSFTQKIVNDPANDYRIIGVFQVLTYQEIFDVLVYAFLFLLLWLVISIILRLFLNSDPGNKGTTKTYFFDHPSPTAEEGSPPIDPGEETSAPPESMPGETPADQADRTAGDNAVVPEGSVADERTPDPADSFFEPGGENDPEPAGPVQRDAVRNLFSPRTGMGWEEHLLPRLKSEIKRTASSDQDMCFALITIDNAAELKDLENIVISLAKIILDLFLFQDLSFEYGKTSFAVILPDVGLEQAVREMEILQRKVAGSRICAQFVNLSIGISCRNGRLVNEEKLLGETRKALELAQQDQKNKIFAFNPDPGKYREMIARKV